MVSILPVDWLVLLGRHDRQPLRRCWRPIRWASCRRAAMLSINSSASRAMRADRVPLAVLLDLHVAPRQVTAALGGRVVLIPMVGSVLHSP